MFLPIQTLEHHEVITSTNGRIQELLRQSVKPKLPCLIIAQQQTAGRGRGNKRWWSGKGAVLMSLGFELAYPVKTGHQFTREHLPGFSAMTARAIIKILRRYMPQDRAMYQLEFRQPNDVYADGKKISGILLESPAPQYAILGIGINVNNRLKDMPKDFLVEEERQPMTSMIDLLNTETDIAQLIDELLIELDHSASLYCLEGRVPNISHDILRFSSEECLKVFDGNIQ